jgi:PAS domain S-box-containing protein
MSPPEWASEEILDQLLEGCQIIDLDWRYRYLNDTAVRHARKTKHELLGKSILEVFPGIENTPLLATLLRCRETQLPQRLDNRFVYPDGDTAWFELVIKPVSRGLLILSQDITAAKQAQEQLEVMQQVMAERRKAEEALKESEAKYRRIVETANEGIWAVDRNFYTTYVNRHMADMLGYAPDDMLGRPVSDFVFPDDLPDLQNQMALRRQDLVGKSEVRFRRRDGSELWTSFTVRATIDESGDFQGSFAMFTDITKRQRAEAALSEEAAWRRFLMEQSRDGIVVLDQNGKVYEANQKYAEMLRYSQEEVQQLYVWDWDAQWTQEELLEQVRKVDSTGDHLETRHRRRDGTFYDVEISTNAAVLGGKKLIFCICRDISQRKQAEKALRESEARLRTLYETVQAGVVLQNCDGEIIHVNQAGCDILALSPTEIMQRASMHPEWHMVLEDGSPVPGEEHPSMITLRTGQPIRNAVRGLYAHDPKKTRWLLINTEPIQDYGTGKVQEVTSTFLDITELKGIEAALRESEQKYRGIFNESVVAIYLFDTKKNFIDANQAGLNLLGYSRTELLGLSMPDVDADPVVVLPAHRELLVGGRLINYEHKLRRKDGAIITVLNNSRALTDGHGNIVGMLSTLIDITERRRAEEWHQTVLRTTLDGYFLVGAQGRILDANDAYCQMVGYSQTELFQMSIADLEAQMSLPEIEENLRLIPIKGSALFETKHHTKTGNLVDLEVRVNFLPWDNGRFVSFARDITVRKQMEQALRENEQFLTDIFNSIQDGLTIIGPDLSILRVNPAMENMFCHQPPIIGRKCYEVRHGRSEPCTNCQIPAVLEMGQIATGMETFTTEVGSLVSVDFKAFPLFNPMTGQVQGAIQSARDITERLRLEGEKGKLESQLFQAQKLEALGTLAGGIAHDFNNILWAIMGYTELTLSSLPEGSKERWNIQQVLKASERARDLINQILAFSRKGDQEKKPLQIALIVKEALQLLRATIPTTIEIKQTISAPEALVLADPTQVHQIIMNLCTNAAQAMWEKGNTLEIGLEEAYLNPGALTDHQDLAPGPCVKLTVRDNGPGIDSDIIDKIFDPFFTTKGVGEGTGMGLAVVYGIVKSHGGAITVSSQPGGGATFSVLLPKIISRKPENQEVQASIPRGRGHILVIDDEEMLISLIQRMLDSLGYEVTTAISALEALKIFRAQTDKFDLVITDQTMPHMDGLQLSREFRHIRPDIPIILCTGFSERVSKETVRATGINALLMKPIDFRNLGETISEVLNKEKQ